MNPVTWLRNGLGGLVPRVWGRECPRGTPVPVTGPCADCDAVALTELSEEEVARVSCLLDPGGVVALRLAGVGVLPGTEIRLLQRRPAYVIRLGFSDLALDRETAAHIRVRRDGIVPPA
jgi:Fe2+ transport system protein FeoA